MTINPATGEPNYQSKIEITKRIENLKVFGDPFAVPGESGNHGMKLAQMTQLEDLELHLWDLSDGTNQRVLQEE